MFARPGVLALLSVLLLTQTRTAVAQSERSASRVNESHRSVVSLTVHPDTVRLDGPRSEQHLAVTGETQDGKRLDLTRGAVYRTSAPSVASVDPRGIVSATGDGASIITVRLGELTASAKVNVERAAVETPVSFAREIVPLLTKAGCNQGACHGGMHGRGGFRLSLLGFDPAFDYDQIVQSAEGRRVVLSEPERSILLLKPTLTMEHGGGERFKAHGREYTFLKQWLEDGAPPPGPRDPEVARLEVWPIERVMNPNEQQQILVRAIWSDGRDEDVTATARYDALNDAVAAVSPSGLITARQQGETSIMIRFAGQAAVVRVTLPYKKVLDYAGFPASNFIDEKLIAKWKALGLSPSPLCSDAEFFRRLHLDAIGSLPQPAEITAFLADPGADKRSRAVDRVLARPEFVDFWAQRWGDLLRINRAQLQDKGMWSFHNWVRAALCDNKPVDELVRDIITAEGSTYTDGPANYFRIGQNPADWAETTAQIFLGVRMQCARCHHHPFEKWTQDDYSGMAAFFVRIGTKRGQDFGLFGGENVVYLRPGGEFVDPRKGGIVRPHPLDGPVMDDPLDRRRRLADWLTAKDNPFFARNFVNRVWSYVMGRGLVEPVDDMRATNPPTNPELLDALAADFVEHHFDLRHLLSTVMKSRAYQLSSHIAPENSADALDVYFARYTVKRLTAEQLADALDLVTGTREKYQGLPPGTKASQLPDPLVRSFLLDVFGRPPRQVACECERGSQPNIAQALHLLNGTFLNQKIGAPGGRLDGLLRAGKPAHAIVEELYLAALSRPPTPRELDKAQAWLAQALSPRDGMQDLLWTLLNSREFLFDH
jgi:hypothetical protein